MRFGGLGSRGCLYNLYLCTSGSIHQPPQWYLSMRLFAGGYGAISWDWPFARLVVVVGAVFSVFLQGARADGRRYVKTPTGI